MRTFAVVIMGATGAGAARAPNASSAALRVRGYGGAVNAEVFLAPATIRPAGCMTNKKKQQLESGNSNEQ